MACEEPASLRSLHPIRRIDVRLDKHRDTVKRSTALLFYRSRAGDRLSFRIDLDHRFEGRAAGSLSDRL
jgi:hypothetical protein